MKLYVHYEPLDVTVVFQCEATYTISQFKTALFAKYASKFGGKEASELFVKNEKNKKLADTDVVEKVLKDREDIFLVDVAQASSAPAPSSPSPFQSPSQPRVVAPSSPAVHPITSSPLVVPVQSPSSLLYVNSNSVPLLSQNSQTASTGTEKNWGNCVCCSQKVEFIPGVKSFRCAHCNAVNVPVTMISQQSDCPNCQKLIFSYNGSPIIRCPDCHIEMVKISCTQCSISFCHTRNSGPLPPCPQCRGTLQDTSIGIQERLTGIQQKLISGESFQQNPALFPSGTNARTVTLIVQYYQDSSLQRQSELDQCLYQNLGNPLIGKVVILLEKNEHAAQVRAQFGSNKIQLVNHGRRVTFQELFVYANTNMQGELCVIANSDIYFDESLRNLVGINFNNTLVTLSRYDILADGSVQFNDWTAHMSQDCWIFIPPVPTDTINVNFFMGQMGCDNRIAHEFRQVNYRLLNPCLKIVTRHIHSSQKRNYTKQGRIPGPYVMVPPSVE